MQLENNIVGQEKTCQGYENSISHIITGEAKPLQASSVSQLICSYFCRISCWMCHNTVKSCHFVECRVLQVRALTSASGIMIWLLPSSPFLHQECQFMGGCCDWAVALSHRLNISIQCKVTGVLQVPALCWFWFWFWIWKAVPALRWTLWPFKYYWDVLDWSQSQLWEGTCWWTQGS